MDCGTILTRPPECREYPVLLDRLERESLSILVVRDGEEVYRSQLPGVRPLLEMVEMFPDGLVSATVADRVVGGCAARVFTLLKPARVLALTGSVSARAILHAAGIDFEPRKGVLEIRNRNGTDLCPFEKLSRHHTDPQQLLPAMRTRLAELRAAAKKQSG